MSELPESIYLQWYGEDGPEDCSELCYHDPKDITWCADKINEHDVKYVRADLYESLRQQLEAAQTERDQLFNKSQHWLDTAAELNRKLAQSEADVRRYQYLRAQRSIDGGFWVAHGGGMHNLTCWNGNALDAEIDAMLALEGEG